MRSFPVSSSASVRLGASIRRRMLLAQVVALALASAIPSLAHADDSGDAEVSQTVNGQRQDLHRPADLDKTGTPLMDLPVSVQVIDKDLVVQQGGVQLNDALRNVSGVSQGGEDGFGFYDRFLIRGLDARIYDQGFDDGDQLNGIPHSLNGVAQIEVLKGPGSALFGSGPPGGTVNLVHYAPSSELGYGGSIQGGSFGSITTTAYATGPTAVPNLNFRVDGLIQHADGFRQLEADNSEIRPALRWTGADHVVDVSVEARYLVGTPDSPGLVYLNGTPITDVSREAKYSTPFSRSYQDVFRLMASDAWTLTPYLTITNRFSYMHRDLGYLRNGDGGTVVGDAFTGRSLRRQQDGDDMYDYQLEPVWTFKTGPVGHTLLTGFEFKRQDLATNRATATLPNITDVFDPVVPETSTAGLVFLRDAKHNGDIDDLEANYYSVYATDQMDLTERWKFRAGVRQDIWDTDLDPLITVPGALTPGGQPIIGGQTLSRHDAPVSWNLGTLYKLTPAIAPFFGVAESHLATFNSESPSSAIAAPESALQYEGGVKINAFGGRALVTAAGFDVKRNNVFSLVGDVAFFDNQETWGGELDLDAQPTSRWRVTANVTAQHAELTSNPSSPSSTGKVPVGVPEHMANLWTSYTFPLSGDDGLRVSGGVDYRDKLYGSTLNTLSVPSYVIGDMELAYLHNQWTFTAGIKNIGDATYFLAANGGGGLVGDPRTFFLSVSLRH